MTTKNCCAECGKDEGVSLKACKSCMLVRYCNADCQKNHWPTHKKDCKRRIAELRDEALFIQDPPPVKKDCPICFLPMPTRLISCVSLPPATIFSVPIYDFAIANIELTKREMEQYYPCCGKSICAGCVHSFICAGNIGKCPFCNSNRGNEHDEHTKQIMKRVAVNDPAAIYMLAHFYYQGLGGLQQDRDKAIELFRRAAELGCSIAAGNLGGIYHEGGNLKKAKFYFEAAAIAGCEASRHELGDIEKDLGNVERAIQHLRIGASAGCYRAMHALQVGFEQGGVSRESIDSTLAAYNNSCAEIRSESRSAFIQHAIHLGN